MQGRYENLLGHFVFIDSSDDGRTKPPPRKGTAPDPTEYKCLVRASLGNKKISTVVRILPVQEVTVMNLSFRTDRSGQTV